MFWPTRPSPTATLIIFKVNFFRTGSPSTFHSLLFHILHLCRGYQGWLILQLPFSLAIITLVLPWLMNCCQAVSVCLDIRPGKRSRFPRCLSPLFIYHPLVLSWPVNCWPVSASLASLAWPMPVYWPVDSARIVTAGKNAFPPLLCLNQVQSGQSISCDWAATLFFKHLFDVALSIVGVCWYFANNSAQEAEKWTFGSTRPSCRPETQRNNSKRHFAPRTLAVAVSGGQTDIPKWNCRLQLFANWLITGWQLHLQAKSTNWGKKSNMKLFGLWNVSGYLLANYEGVASLKEEQLCNQTFFHQEWATEKVGVGKSCVAIIAGSQPRSKSSFEK